MVEARRVEAQGDTPWLDQGERAAWLGLARITALLPAALESQLQRDAGLTLFEYLVMAMLSEQPDRSAQLKSLAVLAGGSQSRLSHVLAKLEQRGYLRRCPSSEDGRVTLAVLTDDGWDAVVAVAPQHVRTVRALVFDDLSASQVASLRGITRRINDNLP